jgi:hypothetical protein
MKRVALLLSVVAGCGGAESSSDGGPDAIAGADLTRPADQAVAADSSTNDQSVPADLSVGDLAQSDLSSVDSSSGQDLRCAPVAFAAAPSPGAMLVVVDRSASMADNNKFVFAAQAIVQAFDGDAFDGMALGMLLAPSGPVASPQCVAQFVPQVACGVPNAPQVALQLAGTNKSTAGSGVRHDIKSYITSTMPEVNDPDSIPLYGALAAAIPAVQSYPNVAARIIFTITDGGFDCTQLSTRPGYADCNMCDHEWEKPQSLIAQLGAAQMDPNAPVQTFVAGIPGADTFDAMACMYPPYHMRAALSAMAYAGSPAYVPANCTGRTFTETTPDPAVSCHLDMTQGNFNAAAVASAITQVRNQVLGCLFDLPTTDGGAVDPGQVNVSYTVNGATVSLSRRANPMNACAMTGCWDYTSDGRVQLIGKACADVSGNAGAQVQLAVGCPTVSM